MEGSEIFQKLIRKRDEYARTLLTAYQIEGENLFILLEKAEQEGKLISLEYPIDPEIGPSEPFVTLQ